MQNYIRIGQGIQITRDIRNSKGLEQRNMGFGWFHQVHTFALTYALLLSACPCA